MGMVSVFINYEFERAFQLPAVQDPMSSRLSDDSDNGHLVARSDKLVGQICRNPLDFSMAL